MANIAVIAAHPDDEALGCGGTLLKHKQQGDNIHFLFMTDGVSARGKDGVKERNEGFEAAMDLIKPDTVTALDLPDNRLDSVSLLDIVKEIESFAKTVQPDVIYTHFPRDLNIDHAITTRAVMTAFRPLPGSSVKKILAFEVLSSTEWALPGDGFVPNYFVDISAQYEAKKKLLECYDGEMRATPHTRSYENVEALAKFRGNSVGVAYAEAFQLIRGIA